MASKMNWLAGATLVLGALHVGTAAQAQDLSDQNCIASNKQALIRPTLLGPDNVRSAEEYAYLQNTRQVFREAADTYQEIAVAEEELQLTPEQRFEGNLFNAINLGNQGRAAEADLRFNALEAQIKKEQAANPEKADPLRLAQLSFARGLNAAQEQKYDEALAFFDRLDTQLGGAGGENEDARQLPDGAVEITDVGALRLSRSSSDARSSRAFGSILGQRTLSQVEKVAILRTHSLYLRSIIYQQRADSALNPDFRARQLEFANSAIRQAAESASIFGAQYQPWLRAKVGARSALLKLDSGDITGARSAAEQALAIYTAYGKGGPLEAELRRTLAVVNLKQGDTNAALAQERAAFCVRAAGADLAPIDTNEVLPLLNLLLAGRDSDDSQSVTREFFRVAAAGMEGDTARVVSQSANLMSQAAESKPEFREAILAEIEVAKLKERLAGFQNEGRPATDQDVILTRKEIATTTARLKEIYSQGVPENLSTQSAAGRAKAAGFLPGQAALAEAANANLGSIQAVLQPGELYVRFVVTPDAGYAIAATSTSARAYRIKDVPGLQTRLQAIQNAVFLGLGGRPRRMLSVMDDSMDAYAALFGPANDMVAGSNRLIIDATGAAANIPFSLLVSRRMSEEELAGLRKKVDASNGLNFTGVPWLGRDRAISMVASAVSFQAQREDAEGSRAPNPIVAFAATPTDYEARRSEIAPKVAEAMQATRRPLYDAEACKTELTRIYEYPGLAGSDTSAMIASRAMAGTDANSVRIVSGPTFTDANMLNFATVPNPGGSTGGLDKYRVLYFGSHGQQPEQNECIQEAVLVMNTPSVAEASAPAGKGKAAFIGDGILTTTEIQSLKLNADLVVLAACETVGMRRIDKDDAGSLSNAEAARLTRLTGLSGGGVIGNFAASFFVAGARSVLATYWLVQNDATNRFMNKFFEATARGVAKADAVQIAQRDLMDDPEFSNPVLWAPFVFIGDGSKTLKVGTIGSPQAEQSPAPSAPEGAAQPS